MSSVLGESNVPDGEYVATTSVEIMADTAGGDGHRVWSVDFEFRISDGPFAGSPLFLTLELREDDPARERCDRGPWYVYGTLAQVYANAPKVFEHSTTPESRARFRANFQPTRPGLVTAEKGTVVRTRYCDRPTMLCAAAALRASLTPGSNRIEPTLSASGSAASSIPEFVLRPPGILAELAAAITETAPLPQPQLSTLGALSFAATVMGQIYIGPTGLGTNLYLLGVAPSGAGKDRPQKAIKAALDACELAEALSDEPLSGSALLTRLGEQPNSLLIIDEFGKFARSIVEQKAGSHQRDIATHWLRLSGEPEPLYTGRMYARPEERKQRPVRYACLNILASTTPSTFYSCLTREQVEDGLMGRFITLSAPDELPKPNQSQDRFMLPRRTVEWAKAIRYPSPHDPAVVVAPCSPYRVAYASDGAESVMRDLDSDSRRCWQEQRDAGSGLEAMTRRWVEWALKLGLVAAAATDPAEPMFRRNVAEWAASFAKYCGERSLAAFTRNVVESLHDRNVKDCLSALERAGAKGLTSDQRLRNVGAFKRLMPRERKDVIAQLIEGGDAVLIGDLLILSRHLAT
jgi:hypothetical protein